MTPIIGLGTGDRLRCKGWPQEGILRMLENTLANAERPEDLVIYGGIGKAARDWPSLRGIVAALRELANDETLVIQSGRAVAVFQTFEHSPRVVIANANLVPRAATPGRFAELRDAGLTMHGQYTAGCWAYIGGQGIMQGSFETFAACAEQHFDGTLAGKIVLTAGLGGMGHAQAPAITMNGGVAMICEVDDEKIRRRSQYIDVVADSTEHAWSVCRDAADQRRTLVVAVPANAADVAEQLIERRTLPDVATDQTSAHDLAGGYLPSGVNVAEAADLRVNDPDAYRARVAETLVRHVRALRSMQRAGVITFEYGNDIRRSALELGMDDAFEIPGFVPLFTRPSFAHGRGPFRWVCLSGNPGDLQTLDSAATRLFPDDERLQHWIAEAPQVVPVEGLPARVCWLGHGDRETMALEINRLVTSGQVTAPVAITRDHLDSGSCCYPTRETEAMPDGSDEIADWPYLNAMLNVAGGADLVAIHQSAGIIGGSCSAGMTFICDGSPSASERIRRCFETDPGIGVVRHASAAVPEAMEYVKDSGIRVPALIPAKKGDLL